MIKKYRKKPVVIEAIKLNEDTASDVLDFINDQSNDRTATRVRSDKFITIHTLEGDMKADYGDYIIKGVQGEFYPCKPDIFEATYEAVNE